MRKEEPNSMGKRDEIRTLFLQGNTQKEIVEAGYAKSTVSEVKAEMEERGELPLTSDNRRLVPLRELPLEAIVENIEFPDVSCRDFKKTARFVLSLVVLGVRLTQELSTIGIQQGKPVIEMAKEMRQSEYQAAQALAEQIAANMAQANTELLSAIRQQRAGSASPMEQLFADLLRQPLMQLLSRTMGMFTGQAQPGISSSPNQPGWQGQTVVQPQTGYGAPGQSQATKEEIKEVFND